MYTTVAAEQNIGRMGISPQTLRSEMPRRETILVADDNAAILDMLASILADAGYNVLVATDGAEALGMVEVHRPDLVLIDFMMPVMDGCTACQRLKSAEGTRELPVVLMSADGKVADKAMEARADHYLLKPFSIDDMLGCVQSFLSLSRERSFDA
ncbi:MAG: response regulator [Dehalococcoidia bacterium]|nr:response regulator [Dehalococcoidia bacterium]